MLAPCQNGVEHRLRLLLYHLLVRHDDERLERATMVWEGSADGEKGVECRVSDVDSVAIAAVSTCPGSQAPVLKIDWADAWSALASVLASKGGRMGPHRSVYTLFNRIFQHSEMFK